MAFEYSNPVAPSIRQRAGSDRAPKQNRDLASDWAYTRYITARPAAKVAVLARDIPADRSFWMRPKRKLALARGLSCGGGLAELSQFSIVTYERRPGHWRAAITPIRRAGTFTSGKTISSIVTPDDSVSEPDARFAAEKIIRKL